MPAKGEGWRHYKGQLYEVVAMALHTETGKPVVVYRAYGGLAEPTLYVRPLDVWLESIPGDKPRPRFAFEREPERPRAAAPPVRREGFIGPGG